MARAGLGTGWNCLFANDIDESKGDVYKNNWGDSHLYICDVRKITTAQIPGLADLAWASFPCQDLSLAGDYSGLRGERSGTFWPFWCLMEALEAEGRPPRMIVLENVYGAVTSNAGRDLVAIGSAYANLGYSFGALVIDARHFVPQSRQRLFVIGVRSEMMVPEELQEKRAVEPWHPPSLREAFYLLPEPSLRRWTWWNPPQPAPRTKGLSDILEENPQGVEWHTFEETQYLLSLMSALNRRKVELAQQSGRRMVGTIYRRTRKESDGIKRQRAEVRFDEVAGCLRTPVGGSSRQTILVVNGNRVQSRLLSPREAARLMGLPESYKLPDGYNDAYHLAGDGVVVDVVRHLAETVFEPILSANQSEKILAEHCVQPV
jgi:DNA (cytosine-5)-methyltransferase 1